MMKPGNRALLVVAVVSLAVTAGSAMAQQKSEATVETGRIQPEHIVKLAANEAVQKDLGVSDDVARRLNSLYSFDYRKAWLKAFPTPPLGPRTPQQRQEERQIEKKINDDLLPRLQELLTAEQYERLRQIQFQNQLNINGPMTLLVFEVASPLKLTDFQKLQLELLDKDFSHSGPFQIVRGKQRYFTMGAEGIQHGKDFRAKAIEMLTENQKVALEKLEGDEFDLLPLVTMSRPIPPPALRNVLPPPRRDGNAQTLPATARQKGTKSGRVVMPQPDDLWHLISLEVVQKDLSISDDVSSRLRSLADDYSAAMEKDCLDAGIDRREYPNKMTAEQRQKYREIEKKNRDELLPQQKDLLSADQVMRFRQIQFQYLLNLNGPMAILAPEVAAELKLTDSQKLQLDALGREYFKSMAPGPIAVVRRSSSQKHREEYTAKAIDVLADWQKEILNKMKGKEIDFS